MPSDNLQKGLPYLPFRLPKKPTPVLAVILLITLFALITVSCTATQMPVETHEDTPGFLLGLWHGFISPLAFIISIFTDRLTVYAFPNNGVWYNFGFMLGIGGFSSGIFAGSKKK